MARFRAYSTDSEDDSVLSSNEVGQEDGDASEVASSLHESPLRRRSHFSAQHSDESGMSEDEEDEIEIRERMVSPPLASVKGADPSITPWAREVGVDPQKMHVMQASLFRVPEEEAAMKAAAQPISRRQLALPSAVSRKHSRDSDGDGLRADSRQRPSFAHDIEPTPFRPSRKYARVESSASAVAGHESALVDFGLAMGRSFRVSWGPGGKLAHLGSLCAPWSSSTSSANSSVVTISTVPTVCGPSSDASERSTKLLAQNLSHTAIEPDADGVPIAIPSRQMAFGSFATLFPPTDRSFEALLFRLGHVLFDPIDLRLADAVTVDIRNRITTLRRKTALSKWLQSAVSTAVDADVRENSGDCTATVFALLTGDQVEKACNVAMDNGDVKLATLLAQAGGDEEFKEDIRAQLAIWREQRIDAHVDENIRKVYALLAGVVGVLEGSKGSGFERCPDVHLSKGLDWKRAFGLHFWFGDALDAPASSAFESYSRHMSQEGSSVAQPVPWYKEESDQCTTGWKLPSGSEPPDALFSLIKLSSKPACSLSQVLTPLSFSPSPSDYRLPWHLYILLSRCLRIRDFADRGDPGVRTDEDDASSESGVEGHSPSADLLASSFALQLEQTGMLQEAVFVLLHIEGSSGRRRAIKDLLGRNAIRLDDWITRGLIGSLKIPMAWINEAKAVHALASGNVYEAYELYLAAGMYNSAHELAVLELAPDAIIKDDLELLKDLFERIDGHAVDGWHVRGKAFLDYAHAMTRLPELRERLVGVNAVPDVTDTTELEELSRSVPKLIGILPDVLHDHSDIRHTAALAEMISGLTLRLDQLRPPAVGSLRSAPVPEATKLHHMRSVAYEKFLRTIEVA